MTPFQCIISNFEKKKNSIVNKSFSPEVFTVVSFLTKGWVVQKMEPKSTFSKYDLTEAKKPHHRYSTWF